MPLMSTIELVLYCHTWYCNVTFASDWIKIVSRFIQFESLTIMKFEMVWRGAELPLMIGSVWNGGSGVLGRQPLHY